MNRYESTKSMKIWSTETFNLGREPYEESSTFENEMNDDECGV